VYVYVVCLTGVPEPIGSRNAIGLVEQIIASAEIVVRGCSLPPERSNG